MGPMSWFLSQNINQISFYSVIAVLFLWGLGLLILKTLIKPLLAVRVVLLPVSFAEIYKIGPSDKDLKEEGIG